MNQNSGFRNILVRLRNQLDWDLFRKPNATGVFVGKDDYSFARGYLNSYKGRDYIGDSLIGQNVSGFNDISNFFQK